MSDYLFIGKVHKDISSEILITSKCPNSATSNGAEEINFYIALYSQKRTETNWTLVGKRSFNQGVLKVSSDEFNMEVGELVVAIPLDSNDIPKEVQNLPKPISRKIDKAPVNERSTIRFIHNNSRSSYQGDYPFGMSLIGKGSLMTFPSMLQNLPKETECLLVVVNIASANLQSKPEHTLKLKHIKTGKIVKEVSFVNNSIAVLPIESELGDDYFITSDSACGIPLYIIKSSVDGVGQISVEHTHPPCELFFGSKKFLGQKMLKTNWFTKPFNESLVTK